MSQNHGLRVCHVICGCTRRCRPNTHTHTLPVCRLERNQQREESVSNMEYLKNVVLKVRPMQPRGWGRILLTLLYNIHQFLQGKSEERTNLIPVITRLLQLSPQEVAYVEQTLKGKLYPILPFITHTHAPLLTQAMQPRSQRQPVTSPHTTMQRGRVGPATCRGGQATD